ncbi:TerB family tellurite resistance protein [Chondromyces apiculatus]|uniref:Co-chaperone DjlA N-terminal domain-containing protein n=1 Tax=Chondromyces apiculatus DSM 436 TaxID=1192034 RepID=A0A017TI62_9BACT|nr:TerB family tellurite resistance protein [Chondromyces apiculatus]EYF08321.1 Hypothetical protein CAP_6082 [Chondromyces apiculatus DSM 436]
MRIQSQSLLDRVARQISRAPTSEPDAASLLTRMAGAYSADPVIDEEEGLARFDPDAAALFEAIIEAAFLVANADGHFDLEERAAFLAMVSSACGGAVKAPRIDALTADFAEQLEEDGEEKRAQMIGRTVTAHHQQMEVMRMAALMAYASGGVSEEELSTLTQLASGMGLDPESVEAVLAQAARALDLG